MTDGDQFSRRVGLNLVQNHAEFALRHVSAVHEHVTLQLLVGRGRLQLVRLVDALVVVAQVEGGTDLKGVEWGRRMILG